MLQIKGDLRGMAIINRCIQWPWMGTWAIFLLLLLWKNEWANRWNWNKVCGLENITNQRNPSIFTWINATLKKHQQNCAERILQSIPFCLHCRDLSGKNAINEHGSASFYLRNPWIKWFTFIHSLVKWGVGTNPL